MRPDKDRAEADGSQGTQAGGNHPDSGIGTKAAPEPYETMHRLGSPTPWIEGAGPDAFAGEGTPGVLFSPPTADVSSEDILDVPTLPSDLVDVEVPRLEQWNAEGDLTFPRLPLERSDVPPVRDELPTNDPGEIESPEEKPDSQDAKENVSVKQMISAVGVTKVPTPRKRIRVIKEPDPEPKTKKPLKVIRRRGKEQQKVFEAEAKDVPSAMLDGVKIPDTADDEDQGV